MPCWARRHRDHASGSCDGDRRGSDDQQRRQWTGSSHWEWWGMRISVVGMGKIGLPLAVQYALKGHEVWGCDINESTVEAINSGLEPFPGEAHLSELLARVTGGGALRATTNTAEAVADSEAVVVVVPLFVDQDAVPDFRAMDAATQAVGAGLQRGTVVSYETTLPVGTTRNRLAPALAALSGLTLGEDLFVVFSPERVLTGRVFADLRRYPKLLGESTRPARRRAFPSTSRFWTSISAMTCHVQTACGDWDPAKPLRWPSWPKLLTATSISHWQISSPYTH